MIKDFIDGTTSYLAAIRHISKHGMWGYVILPGILSVLTGIGVFGTAWGLSDNIGGLIDNLWPWDWGRGVVGKAAQVFGGLLLLLLGLIVFKQIIMVLLAPFMSILSEKVENQLLGNSDGGTKLSLRQVVSDVFRGLRIALRNIARELPLTIFLLLLGLVPVFSPFTTALIFVVQAYYAGFGNMDFTLERHFRYQDSVRFVKRNRGMAIGNGAVFLVMLFTFAGFLFALPLSTVAATIETTRRLKQS